MARGRAAKLVVARRDAEETLSSSSSSAADDDWVDSDADADNAVLDDAAEMSDDQHLNSAEPAVGSTGKGDHARPSQEGFSLTAKKPLSISLSSKNKQTCKVCGKTGHAAGFVGSVYLDCPNKPCYLCKQLGHTTATCPFRLQPGHGCTVDRGGSKASAVAQLQDREGGGSRRVRCSASSRRGKWRVEAAILKLHQRRCCCLEFPPTNRHGIVLSGDKQGAIAVWNYRAVHERTLYKFHTCLCNTIRFLPWHDAACAASASSDGTVKLFDVETGAHGTLLECNPGGWSQGAPWHMVYGCDSSASLRTILAGDSRGLVHVLDPRLDTPVAALQLHKPGTKVVSIQVHPTLPTCILTAGNDHCARVFDVRKLMAAGGSGAASAGAAGPAGKGPGGGKGERGSHPAQLACMPHPRVVNAAYFSPVTGQKILTTCQDNRIRLWDCMLRADMAADREIVHSHDFNRYLTPFKAEWDPKDRMEAQIVCGRYISEDFNGVALHPVDLLDARTGELLQELTDYNITTISPVNKPHPHEDIIISGSSRSLYMWTLQHDDDDDQDLAAEASSSSGRMHGGVHPGEHGALSHPGLQRNDYFVYFDADPGPQKKASKKQKLAGTAVQDYDDEDG